MEKPNLLFIDCQNQKEAHPVVRPTPSSADPPLNRPLLSPAPPRPPPWSAAQSSPALVFKKMAKSKQRQHPNKKNSTPSDFEEDGWVIVKKQRVAIFIPPLPITPQQPQCQLAIHYIYSPQFPPNSLIILQIHPCQHWSPQNPTSLHER
ncbi:hypothetical protein L2E82_36300 [Cichorium intybus]|uniref:Uncharacterized protein n=1 Tax=Cichorium intybus TaxID=13427 RepID=A0ACB9BR61_CICIN|nr:hypothetical protein L2E82_36300 [Cichorium intybus]